MQAPDLRLRRVAPVPHQLLKSECEARWQRGWCLEQDADPGKTGIQIGFGPLLASGTYFVVINAADNVTGTIRLALTQLNSTLPVTGSGVLARITFKPVGPTGVSSIHFTQVQLASRTGNPILSTTQDGTINVQLGPPPKYLYLPLIIRNF